MNDIKIFQDSKRQIQIEVWFERETVWLTQEQIASFFGTKRPAITKHLGNIFASGELMENVVCSKIEHTTRHGALANKKHNVLYPIKP